MVNPFPPSTYWGLAIGLYLFLGGLAGGAYVTGAVADVLSDREADRRAAHRTTARWGMVLAVAAIAIGGLLLLSHLGKPLNVLYFWLFTNLNSWMTIGVWVILVFTGLAAIQGLWMGFGEDDGFGVDVGFVDRLADLTRPSERVRRAVLGVGAVIGLVLIVYTALLLSAAGAIVPLWNRTWLPLLFLASGLSIGIASAVGITTVTVGVVDSGVQRFSIADDVVILAELGVLALLLWTLSNGSPTAVATYERLLSEGWLILWGGVVGLGMVVPLAISGGLLVAERRYDVEASDRLRRLATAGYAAKFLAVVLGGLMLRLVIIFGALNSPVIGVSPI